MDPSCPVPLPNSYWVLPGQFLAGEHPGDSNVVFATKRLSALLDAGVRVFVDLTDEDEINEDARPVPHYRPLIRGLADERHIDVTYVRFPVVDRGVPSIWTMRCVLDVVERSLADENPVYVHCWAGRGRTGTVVGCFLRRRSMASEEVVIARIGELRRMMPLGRESSPHTPEQVRMVRTWKTGV